jgi:hypothetical protein
MRYAILITAVLGAIVSTACSSEQGYNTGQAWQRNQCETLPSMQDRERCVSQSNSSYDNYKRETDKR